MTAQLTPLYITLAVCAVVSIAVVLAVTLTNKPAPPAPKPRSCDPKKVDCLNGGTCDPDSKTCVCTPQWTGDRCQLIKTPPQVSTSANQTCGAQAKACETDDDCFSCNTTVPFQCAEVSEEDNKTGLKGKYCLPVKPANACAAVAPDADYSKVIPGKYIWEGWQNVDTQKWTCECEYPDYYAPDKSGACTKSAQLCTNGVWKFPVPADPNAPPFTREQEAEYAHASPLIYGRCDCENVPCTGDSDCASGECSDQGVCLNQRTALNPVNGLPMCIRDTCAPYGKWVGEDVPPYSYGRCMCTGGSVDTGYGCYKPPPPEPTNKCDKNCSDNGTCLPGNVCLCNTGWRGKDCSEFYCESGCPNQGACVGPNTCQCKPGETFVSRVVMNAKQKKKALKLAKKGIFKAAGSEVGSCMPMVACFPTPSVNATTGIIENAGAFPNATQTECVRGSTDQLNTLCKQKGWDKYDPGAGKCIRTIDCSKTACDATGYCTPTMFQQLGFTVPKVPYGDDTCVNPSLAEVQKMCANKSTSTETYVLPNRLIDGIYQCLNFAPQYTLDIGDSLTAIKNRGVVGKFCVPNVSAADKQRDGNGLLAVWRIWLGSQLDPNAPEVINENNAYASGTAQLEVIADSTSSCSGYYYGFKALFTPGTPSFTLPADEPLLFALYAWPSNLWTCENMEQGMQNINTCAPLYITRNSYKLITLTAGAVPPGESDALIPVFRPDVAVQLAQNAGWASSVVNQLATTSTAIAGGQVEALPIQPPGPNDAAVQAACTSDFCKQFSGTPGVKLVVLVWEYLTGRPSDLGAMCSFVASEFKSVKYKLVRDGTAGTVTLLGPTSPLSKNLVQDPTTKKYYVYYVDVVDVNRTYTYNLGAYVAQSVDDTITTYETAPCKSAYVPVTVYVSTYSEAFCQGVLPPIDSTTPMPPFMWFSTSTGMCTWLPGDTAASDYWCAVKMSGASTFDSAHLKLVDNDDFCSSLQASYPVLEAANNWTTSSCNPCDPSSPTCWDSVGTGETSNACLKGMPQSRSVTCSQELPLATSGKIADYTDFATRMGSMYEFYKQHHVGAPVAGIDVLADTPGLQSVFNQYYHCGPADNPMWGTRTYSDSSVNPCEADDASCSAAWQVAQACGKTNACGVWQTNSGGPSSKLWTFQQQRLCYPFDGYQTTPSPCCGNHGKYALDVALREGSRVSVMQPSTRLMKAGVVTKYASGTGSIDVKYDDGTSVQNLALKYVQLETMSNRGACDCSGTTYGQPDCTVDLCANQTCNSQGKCQWNAATKDVRCVCDTFVDEDGNTQRYLNYRQKAPSDLYPAEYDKFACNWNSCLPVNGVQCGGVAYSTDYLYAPFQWKEEANGTKTKQYYDLNPATLQPYVRTGSDGKKYWAAGSCNHGTGQCDCADACSKPGDAGCTAGWGCVNGACVNRTQSTAQGAPGNCYDKYHK